MSEKLPRALRDATHRTILQYLNEVEGMLIPSTEEGHFTFKKNTLAWIMQLSGGSANPRLVQQFIDDHLTPGNIIAYSFLDELRDILHQKIAEFEIGL